MASFSLPVNVSANMRSRRWTFDLSTRPARLLLLAVRAAVAMMVALLTWAYARIDSGESALVGFLALYILATAEGLARGHRR